MPTDPDTCDHEWEPMGFTGPYPTEGCHRCRSVAFLDAPDHPPALDVFDANTTNRPPEVNT